LPQECHIWQTNNSPPGKETTDFRTSVVHRRKAVGRKTSTAVKPITGIAEQW